MALGFLIVTKRNTNTSPRERYRLHAIITPNVETQ